MGWGAPQVWDCRGVEKDASFRSRLTYSAQGVRPRRCGSKPHVGLGLHSSFHTSKTVLCVRPFIPTTKCIRMCIQAGIC